MFRNKLSIVLLLLVALTLTGCFSKQDPTTLKSVGIKLVDSSSVLGLGEIITIQASGVNAKGEPIDLEDIKWTISKEEVGSLDKKDTAEVKFTGSEKGGNVTLTITAQDGVTASVDLAVVDIDYAVIPGYPFIDQGGFPEDRQAESLEGNSDKRGYELSKIASNWNDKNHWIAWDIAVPMDDDYFFVMRYASGKDPAEPRKRDLKMMDNGGAKTLLDEVLLEKSGSSQSFGRDAAGWNFYISEDTFTLNEGKQKIRMENIGEDKEGVNVAWLGFVKASPSNIELTDEQWITVIDNNLEMSLSDW